MKVILSSQIDFGIIYNKESEVTNEIKDLMKKAYRDGETENVKVQKYNTFAVVAIRNPKTGKVTAGNVYAKGTRVTFNIPMNCKHVADELITEFTEELLDELKIDVKTEELTESESHVIIKKTQTQEVQMDANLQEEIRNIVASGEKKGSTPEGKEFEVKSSAGVRKIKFGDEFYTAIGTKRVRVLKSTEKEFNEIAGGKKKPAKAKADKPAKAKKSKDPKPAREDVKCAKCGETFSRSKFAPNQTECPKCKPRRGGEAKPARITVKCETCGKDFETSKFTPNAKQCHDCKPRRSKGESKPVEPRKCEVTGEMFTPSKFNPNAKVSPEGLKIQKLENAKAGRITTAFEKIRDQKVLEGTGASEIQKALEMAWDEGIHAIPSMIKAVKVHFGPKKVKSEKATNYEAPQEDQEEVK